MTYKEQADEIVRKHITCINGGHGLLNPPDWVIKQSVNHAILQVEAMLSVNSNIDALATAENKDLKRIYLHLKKEQNNLQSILTELKNML